MKHCQYEGSFDPSGNLPLPAFLYLLSHRAGYAAASTQKQTVPDLLSCQFHEETILSFLQIVAKEKEFMGENLAFQ